MEGKSFDLEAVYDAEIAPLMAKVIEICKTHKMPMFATFLYACRPDEEEHDFCTTNLMFNERPVPPEMLELAKSIYRSSRPAALRIRVTKGDGSVEDMVILP